MFIYKEKVISCQIDFNLLQDSLGKFRKMKNFNIDANSVLASFKDWVQGILDDFDKFIEINPAMMLALKIFSIDKKYQEVPFSKKVE